MDRDNSKFEGSGVWKWPRCVSRSVDKGKAKHEEVKELYQRLPGAGL